tara:strand:- start:3147 stop:3977 length:831 start_codon:yes stop_codon:yes gene_type:complete
MLFWIFVGLVISGSALAYLLLVYLPQQRLQRAQNRPFPAQWQAMLQRLPLYKRLPEPLQRELVQKIKTFLHEKRFVGCDGLAVTDEMRVLIAAQACVLLLNRPTTGYSDLNWIYLYPGEFRSRIPERDHTGVVSHASGSLAGVSWENGRVVLAWDSVRRGMQRDNDGYNVVLHEFAHQLDQEDGSADGAPLLYKRDDYSNWSEVFGREFERLRAALDAGEDTLIDPYGATEPAEFFAVLTELFYERPAALAEHAPELYEALAAYYRVNPREWTAPS